ncbi:MAG: protein kinase [Bryobacterales bacterium]|nr:protein kinase [Bryobacterales bacterium]
MTGPPSTSMIGRLFGPYEVTRLIGSGGMGSVYQAARVDGQFNKQAALKVISPDAAGPHAIGHFLQERETLAALDHPNIVKLLDGGVTAEGLPYFLMDYVEGTPIDEYCNARKLGIEQRLHLFLQVCAAVQYAHRALIVHRDIKPRNILVTAEGVPKLLDFGIAKLMRAAAGHGHTQASELTQSFRTFTIEYASPEQLRSGPITIAVDIYALGVLLHQLLAGCWPYAVETPSEVALAYAICELPPEKPSDSVFRKDPAAIAAQRSTAPEKLRQRLAGDLDAIVLKAIRKQPEQRYSSCAALAADIERHLASKPVEARPSTFLYVLGGFARRNRAAFAAGALAVLILIAGVVGIIRQSRKAETQRALAERRFNELRALLGTFLFDVHDSIRDMPGSAYARSRIIAKTSEYLSWLAAESSTNTSLQLDLADAYIKLAGAQGSPYETNLGNTRQALDTYAKARAVAESVLRAHPGNPRARRYVALAILRTADIDEQQGRLPEAINRAKTALKTLLDLSLAQPGSIDAHQDLASAHESLGDFSSSNDQRAIALDHYQASLAENRAVLAIDPANFRSRRGVAIMKMKIGDIRRANGEASLALAEYQLATEAVDTLYAETHRDGLKRLRAMLIGKTGHVRFEMLDYKGALERYQEQRSIYEGLARLDPGDKRALLDMASTLKNESDVYWQLDNMPQALASTLRSLEIMDKLATGDPSNEIIHERLALLEILAGDYFVELHNPTEARAHTSRGLALLKELAAAPEARPALIHSYANALLTARPEELRNPALALEIAKIAAQKTNRSDLVFLDTLARAYQANGDSPAAIQTIEEAISKLPPSTQPSHLRQVLENHLAQFRAQTQPPTR